MAPNRLARSTSPYLHQHAQNPVDWYPWGDEAFQKAQDEDKPVFLSIGYSTCHWCHVMAHESFEDEDVARLLNDAFVNIKVDREERPDVDHTYMTVCQMMTGSGGWPLTILLTPDKKPFYAATYIPKETHGGRPGLKDLVPRIQEAWHERRDDLIHRADDVVEHLKSAGQPRAGEPIDDAVIEDAFDTLARNYDPEHGGFGRAPKFPSPHNLLFLLRAGRNHDLRAADRMVRQTLTRIRHGGIWDHVGFGFHRYSIDRTWHVPHFEKMLYDQAMHVLAYTEAYEALGDEALADTARRTCEYVLRDLRDPDGGFHSAEDADSEGEEGRFYVWTRHEIEDVLGDDADLFTAAYDVQEHGNYTDEASGRLTGTNVLRRVRTDEQLADANDRTAVEVADILETARKTLFEHREQRVRPGRDDKVLTDWNGLMLAALARAGLILEEPDFLDAAKNAATFLTTTMNADGNLRHQWKDGEAGVDAFLDDHAYLAWGLLELHQATLDDAWATHAIDVTQAMIDGFWDDDDGAFWFTRHGQKDLPVRRKEVYDGAQPSGNSVALDVLVRLGRLTGDPAYEKRADDLQKALGATVRQNPNGHTHLLTAAHMARAPDVEIVIAGDPQADATRRLLETARGPYLPQRVLLLRTPATDAPGFAPFTQEMGPENGAAAAYVCRNHACDAPVTDADALAEKLTASTG